jgi:hypothetical protein
MQRLVLSTDDVPEAERFAYWREAGGELIGVSGERNKDQETPFGSTAEVTACHSLVHVRSRSDGFPVLRRRQDIARRSWADHVSLYRERSPGVWFEHSGSEFVTRPGDLVVADPTVPFVTKPGKVYHQDIVNVSRRMLEPHLPASGLRRALVLNGDSGVGGLVTS